MTSLLKNGHNSEAHQFLRRFHSTEDRLGPSARFSCRPVSSLWTLICLP